ncbi:MAG TPA: Bax inhibitor-1/YccA family protein [Acidimicrobiales bacterium]|nr:Bax inhibitor-1/YccA family protein [Acidimicrobiales bacterium]
MRTANPALSDTAFERAVADWAPPTGAPVDVDQRTDVMTVRGTIWATAALLALVVATGVFGWNSVERGLEGQAIALPGWLIVAMLGGLGIAILTIFKPNLARFTAPLYAAVQGLVLGAISAVYNSAYEGIVVQAVGLTLGVMGLMLFLYASRIIKVTEKLRMGIVAATGAIFLVYMVSFVINLFGGSAPFIHDTGAVGILISLAIVGVAAFNFLLDFDFIEKASAAGAPRRMEWFAAFGLLVTLVWLYLEMLRLLAKLRE